MNEIFFTYFFVIIYNIKYYKQEIYIYTYIIIIIELSFNHSIKRYTLK